MRQTTHSEFDFNMQVSFSFAEIVRLDTFIYMCLVPVSVAAKANHSVLITYHGAAGKYNPIAS